VTTPARSWHAPTKASRLRWAHVWFAWSLAASCSWKSTCPHVGTCHARLDMPRVHDSSHQRHSARFRLASPRPHASQGSRLATSAQLAEQQDTDLTVTAPPRVAVCRRPQVPLRLQQCRRRRLHPSKPPRLSHGRPPTRHDRKSINTLNAR
jgi:hypothetical protein